MNKDIVLSASLIDGRGLTVFAQVRRSTRQWLAGLLLGAWSVVVATAAPTITGLGSVRQIINPGQSANLSVTASGSGTITYQWARKGVALAGATDSTLSVSNATNVDSGWYFVDVTDGTGTSRSAPMFVQVTPASTQVLGWGYNTYGQLSFPSDLNNATALAAGDLHSMALHPDGTVTAWGTNLPGPTHGPAGLSNVVSIGVGAQFAVALKSDGTVVAWGNNSYHELNIPANLSNVVAIAAGYRHELAIRVDGTIAAWGGTDSTAANVPAGLTGVVAIGAGMWHSLAIKNDGTVVAWGTNTYGQTNVPAGLANVIAVAGGGSHSLALKGDGTVVAWGANPWGQCTVPPSLSGVIAISAGMDDSMALKSDGTVVAWGSNYSGYSTLTPRPSNLGQVSAISAGLRYWLALRDTSGDAAPAITVQPSSVVSAETTTASLAVTATGVGPITYQWRKNSVNISGATATNFSLADLKLSDAGSYDVVVSNQIGSTTSASVMLTVNPVPVVTSLSPARQVLAPGQSLSLGISATGHGVLTYQWVRNGRAIPGANAATLSLAGLTLGDSGCYVVDVTDDYGTRHGAPFFAFVVPTTTQVRAWGGAGYEQSDLPVGLADVIAISAGGSHSLALKRDGTVVAWGYNGGGQSTVPAGLADVVAISAGADNSVALKSDGTVVAWGQNSFGECDVPVGLTGVVAIAAGNDHTLALKNDGKVVGWGANFYGSLDIPSGLSGVSAISAGTSFSLALKNDGTVVGWGDNSDGQAGVGSGLTGVRAISAGALHALALLDSGLVVGAGYGGYVQVTPPVGLTGVTAVSAGVYHSLAIQSDRTVIAWGGYYIGESNPPAGLSDVIAVSASCGGGYLFSLALRDASNDTVPNVVVPPVSYVGVEEQAATFTVTASGPGPIAYQWRKDGVNLSGANAATLTLANLQLADAGSYDVVVTNYIGSVTSAAVTLAVTPIPVVTNLSLSRIVLSPSQDLNLAVTATGTGPLGYQWTRNGRPISGATNSSFSSTAVAVQDGGCYAVLVTDDIGTRRSDSFFINVAPEFTKVRMWGDNRYGQSTNQAGLNDSIAVEGGTAHVLALRRDGTVVGWGYAGYGQSAIPAGLTDVVAIADGNDHSLALKSNGTVVAWGQNYDGQASVPAGLANVVAIAAGDRCSLALKSDGTVVAWGFDSGGQWRVPVGLNNVVAITAGSAHFFAVKKDGTVVAWGTNLYGELPAPAGLSGVISVVATTYDSLALKNDGTVVGWGIGISNDHSVSGSITNAVAIAGGTNHFMALKGDGTVVAWSQDYLSGQAVVPAGLTGCVGLGAGDNQSLVIRDAASDPEPTITTQPVDQIITAGNFVTFTVAAIGSPAPTFQWKKEGVAISGATGNSYTIATAIVGDAGGYTVVATNSVGSDTSRTATLTVNVVPAVTTQPVSQAITTGNSVTFTVAANGSPAPTYQWKKNGVSINGATGSSYTIASTVLGDAGSYTVVATNVAGLAASNAAILTVGTPPAGFDVAGYLSRYPDVAALHGSNPYGAWIYYHDHGIYQGEVFDDLFRVDEYLALYPELFAIFGSDLGGALDHWLSTGRIEGKLGRIPLEFKAQGYFDRNPDVAAAVGNDPILAWGHYWLYGIYEGRAYDDELRVFEYLAVNADLTAAFVNDWRQAALHWMRYGRTEGRLGRLPLTFNVTEYLVRSPDVAAVWGTHPTTVFLHYWAYGIDEGRTYDDLFRPVEYLALNPDLAAALGTDRRKAFKHWVRYGQTEGRLGRNP